MYERIRALREDKDMTQTEVAGMLNISQRAYSYYENGERTIPLELLCKIADLHETSIDYLLNRTDTKKAYKPKK